MQIPIVDSKMKLIGLYMWDEIFKPNKFSNTVVIMAGGKGSRLLPHTENCPKGMLLIAGKPILEHILSRFKTEGFSQFVIAIQHLGYQIENYFGDGKQLGVNIEYLKESYPLGTAGALSLLNPAPRDSFLVTNCDVMTGAQITNLLEFHKQTGATATMAVKNHEWVNPFGVVETEGIEITSYREKPVIRSTINAGLYVLEPKVLDYLSTNNAIDMSALFEKFILNKERVVSYPIFESWLDIGTPSNLAEAYKINYFEDSAKKV
jgi:NDP-sugar pyrophosphorylase family protein